MMGNWRFAMIFGISTLHLLDLNAEGRYAALDEEFFSLSVVRAGKLSDAKARGWIRE